MDLTGLKRQHENILALVEKIKRLQGGDPAQKALEISLSLGELSGIISFHLNSEDNYLYPGLLRHPSPRVQETAHLFMDEMGDLAGKFTGFKRKYLAAGMIKADPPGFTRESEAVFTALKERILREEGQLYPLLG